MVRFRKISFRYTAPSWSTHRTRISRVCAFAKTKQPASELSQNYLQNIPSSLLEYLLNSSHQSLPITSTICKLFSSIRWVCNSWFKNLAIDFEFFGVKKVKCSPGRKCDVLFSCQRYQVEIVGSFITTIFRQSIHSAAYRFDSSCAVALLMPDDSSGQNSSLHPDR